MTDMPKNTGGNFSAGSKFEQKPKCTHNVFASQVNVYRLTDTEGGPVTGYAAEVMVKCKDCDMPFQWLGVDKGISTVKPMASILGTELRAPIIPIEED